GARTGAPMATRRARMRAVRRRGTARSAPAEETLDIGESELDIGRAAVIALPAMRCRLHFAQQRVHLGVVEAAAGAHAAVAGERTADRLEPLLQGERLAEL